MSRRASSAVALDLKRAFLGLARFAPLSTSKAFQEWRGYLHLLRDVHEDLSDIDQSRPGLLDELMMDAREDQEEVLVEIDALIARYVGPVPARAR